MLLKIRTANSIPQAREHHEQKNEVNEAHAGRAQQNPTACRRPMAIRRALPIHRVVADGLLVSSQWRHAKDDGASTGDRHKRTVTRAASQHASGSGGAAVADAEAAAAADEAAGSEEMSKLMEQYDEKQEAASHSEIIEVTVVAYTEHGVVVDTGQKTEGLIPAAEFSETEIPAPRAERQN